MMNLFKPGKSITVISRETSNAESYVLGTVDKLGLVCHARSTFHSKDLGVLQSPWMAQTIQFRSSYTFEELYLSEDDTRLIVDYLNSEKISKENVKTQNTKLAEPNGIETYPTPAGSTWQNVTIRLSPGGIKSKELQDRESQDHELEITVKGGKSKTYFYHQLGFMKRNSRKPNRHWYLLGNFAYLNGEIESDSILPYSIESKGETTGVTPEDKQALSNLLKKFMKIEDDPFTSLGGNGYRTKFTISFSKNYLKSLNRHQAKARLQENDPMVSDRHVGEDDDHEDRE